MPGHDPTFRLVPRRRPPVQDGPSLFDQPPEPPLFAAPEPPVTIAERFVRFHDAHPEVYRELVRLTRQAKEAGRARVGMKMLFEIVRWHRVIVGPDDEESFKLNNVYSSRYARLIEEQEPDLQGMFATRELKSA